MKIYDEEETLAENTRVPSSDGNPKLMLDACIINNCYDAGIMGIAASIDAFRFREALTYFMEVARVGNKYLADTEPWKVIPPAGWAARADGYEGVLKTTKVQHPVAQEFYGKNADVRLLVIDELASAGRVEIAGLDMLGFDFVEQRQHAVRAAEQSFSDFAAERRRVAAPIFHQ